MGNFTFIGFRWNLNVPREQKLSFNLISAGAFYHLISSWYDLNPTFYDSIYFPSEAIDITIFLFLTIGWGVVEYNDKLNLKIIMIIKPPPTLCSMTTFEEWGLNVSPFNFCCALPFPQHWIPLWKIISHLLASQSDAHRIAPHRDPNPRPRPIHL